jgi:hypothetical protein
MSFNDNPRENMNMNGVPRSNWPTSSWIGGAIVVILILFGIGYMSHDSWMGTSSVHNAAVTDMPAPATAPVTPLPKMTPVAPAAAPSAAAATPAATPKP